jgi:DNA ligase-1
MTIIKSFETLYNKTIGTDREKQWSIEVIDNGNDTFTIRTYHGIVNGKMVKHEKIISEGKNINKKNQTTTKEQALLEAEREWIKKKKQGYLPQQMVIEKKEKKMLKPMLAIEFNKDSVSFPIYIQPKLDGVRCLIYKMNNKIIFQSRQNTIYEPFIHLLSELEIIFSKLSSNFILDGELYTHGMGFENITGIVRRSKNKHSDTDKIQYHIYDCFYDGDENNIPYSKRFSILQSLFHNENFSNLILVETTLIHTESDIEKYHSYYTNMNPSYEGIMIRTVNGLYKQQNRSKDLQKYKKFLDEEFEIIGHFEGTGSHMGTPIFECKLNDDPSKTFRVMLQGTLENRKNIMKNIQSYYGKSLTVKYQEKSKNGIPRFPVGLEIRDYE